MPPRAGRVYVQAGKAGRAIRYAGAVDWGRGEGLKRCGELEILPLVFGQIKSIMVEVGAIVLEYIAAKFPKWFGTSQDHQTAYKQLTSSFIVVHIHDPSGFN